MSTTPDTLPVVITSWHDPVVDEHGHDPRGTYVEWFWLPVIGPTATLAFRRFNELLAGGDEISVDLASLARSFGMNLGVFERAVNRLVMFGLASASPYGYAVRRSAPSVAARHEARYCPELRAAHRVHLDQLAAAKTAA